MSERRRTDHWGLPKAILGGKEQREVRDGDIQCRWVLTMGTETRMPNLPSWRYSGEATWDMLLWSSWSADLREGERLNGLQERGLDRESEDLAKRMGTMSDSDKMGKTLT